MLQIGFWHGRPARAAGGNTSTTETGPPPTPSMTLNISSKFPAIVTCTGYDRVPSSIQSPDGRKKGQGQRGGSRGIHIQSSATEPRRHREKLLSVSPWLCGQIGALPTGAIRSGNRLRFRFGQVKINGSQLFWSAATCQTGRRYGPGVRKAATSRRTPYRARYLSVFACIAWQPDSHF